MNNSITCFHWKILALCRDLNPGPPWYQADILPTELSWLGYLENCLDFQCFRYSDVRFLDTHCRTNPVLFLDLLLGRQDRVESSLTTLERVLRLRSHILRKRQRLRTKTTSSKAGHGQGGHALPQPFAINVIRDGRQLFCRIHDSHHSVEIFLSVRRWKTSQFDFCSWIQDQEVRCRNFAF